MQKYVIALYIRLSIEDYKYDMRKSLRPQNRIRQETGGIYEKDTICNT